MADPARRPPSSALGPVALAVAGLGLALADWGLWTPDPAGDNDRQQFSADRALAALHPVLGADPTSRPTGSPALHATQDKLVTAFGDLGLEVDDRTWLSCSDRQAVCGRVRNLRVRVPGRNAGPSVLLASHSDSVGAGPGVGDSAASVAILFEVARALFVEPAWGPVDLLLTDGEEVDLLGARAFVAQDPAWADVAVVVNLEARGTGGRSWMFEVSDDWLVETYAKAVPHPATTSVATAVYRNMPVDTDLTVFRQARPGLGLAFIGGAARYHTPLDDLKHLDAGSLQQQGETALALVRAISARLPEDPPVGVADGRGPRAWTDLFGQLTLVWPAAASWLLIGLGGLGTLVAAASGGALMVVRAVLNLGLRLLLGAGLCLVVALLLVRFDLAPGMFPNRLDAAAALLLLVGATPMALWDRGGDPQARLALTTLLWTALAALSHTVEPGASWVLALPAAAGGVASLLPWAARGLLPMVAASLVLPVFALVLPEALGAPLVISLGLVGLVWASWLPPLLGPGGGRSTAWMLGAGAAGALVVLLLTPSFTADVPQGANIRVIGDSDGSRLSTWADGPDPLAAAMAAAGMALPLAGPPLPDGPVLTVLPAGDTLHLRSQRGATTLRLNLEDPAQTVLVRYPGLVEQPLRRGLVGPLTLVGVPEEGVEVVVTGTLGAATLTDRSPGLPADVGRLWSRRPGAPFVPIHDGDITEVVTTIQLGAATTVPEPAPAPATEGDAPWDEER
jgi:Peptidase family M28